MWKLSQPQQPADPAQIQQPAAFVHVASIPTHSEHSLSTMSSGTSREMPTQASKSKEPTHEVVRPEPVEDATTVTSNAREKEKERVEQVARAIAQVAYHDIDHHDSHSFDGAYTLAERMWGHNYGNEDTRISAQAAHDRAIAGQAYGYVSFLRQDAISFDRAYSLAVYFGVRDVSAAPTGPPQPQQPADPAQLQQPADPAQIQQPPHQDAHPAQNQQGAHPAQDQHAISPNQGAVVQDQHAIVQNQHAEEIKSVISTMMKYPKDSVVQIRGMESLESILQSSSSKADTTATILGCGGASAFSMAMRMHSENEEIQGKGLIGGAAKWALYAGENLRSLVNFIPAILRNLKCHSEHLDLQRDACKALSMLLVTEFEGMFIGEVVEAGGVEAVTRTVRRHCRVTQISRAGGVVLTRLCDDRNFIQRFVKASGIDIIVPLMKTFEKDEQMQEIGCCLIWTLLRGHDDVAETMASDGFIGVLLSALQHHENSKSIQCQASGILGRLAEKNEKCRTQISERGVYRALFALRKYSSCPKVSNVEFQLLGVLAKDNRAGQDCFVANGGVQNIVTALSVHENDPDTLKMCLKTVLAVIENNGAAKSVFLRDGLVKVLVCALRSAGCRAAVSQFTGILALHQLLEGAENRAVHISMAVNAGCIRAAVAAMKKHERDLNIREIGSELLALCAQGHEEAFISAGGLVAMLTATSLSALFNEHSKASRLNDIWVATTISLFQFDSTTSSHVLEHGFLGLLVSGIGKLDCEKSKAMGFDLIAHCLIDEKRAHSQIGLSGPVIAVALAGMRAYPENVQLQTSGFWILARLVSTKSTTVDSKAFIKKSRECVHAAGMKIILSILRWHPFEDDMNYAASFVMRAIVDHVNGNDEKRTPKADINDID